ncbi:anaerobic ribonucleoside-triphosphate reductase-activating protein [Lachnospiraceae bacterium]|nr:anaerobic ribonucleoside-triphosphate reductase-activating protein [Lachnospiraceae bacterium]
MNTIECAGFLENSCDDGPGIRSVLFLQGCSKNCKECHNAAIKEHGKGVMIEIEQLIKYIDKKCCNKKITISGGEPLEQLENLVTLVECLQSKGYNICLYTGWEFEKVPKRLLKFLNYIKTGEFINNLKNPNIQFVGSSNQKMYFIDKETINEISLSIYAEE